MSSFSADKIKLGGSTINSVDTTIQINNGDTTSKVASILTGNDSPITLTITPDFIGQLYVDTSINANAYIAVGTTDQNDWKQINNA
jgi:hypothetical protein